MLLVRDERLVEFSFSSVFGSDVGHEAVLQIARRSWSENRRAAVTGYLRIDGDKIEQTVEGPCTVILALAARILTDRRHGEIVIRRFGPIGGRQHTEWTVAGLEICVPADTAPADPRGALRLLTRADAPSRVAAGPALAVARAT